MIKVNSEGYILPKCSTPTINDPLWVHYTYPGGKNRCMERYHHTVLPNCTGYAWGRFMQLLGETPKLSTADAGMWYSATSDGYKRSGDYGGRPQLGAVACWGQYGDAGHVAIVEKINKDGSIVISESGFNYSATPWSNVYHEHTVYPPNYRVPWMGNDFYFQGFIYNPACENISTALNDFISVVKQHTNADKAWVKSVLGGDIGHWNVAFICACAKTAEVPKTIIPQTTSASTLLSNGSGSILPRSVTKLQVGDIIGVSPQQELGVVISTTESTSTVVIGDQGSNDPNVSHVVTRKISSNNKGVFGIWRPNWNVGEPISTGNLAFVNTNLYDARSGPGDAICREICYLDNTYEPSINTSDIKLSIINYTDVAQGAFKLFATLLNSASGQPSVVSKLSTSVDSGQLKDISSTERAGFEYFQSKGLRISATIGIMANIFCESHWNLTAAKVDEIEASYGLNQWNVRAGRDMRGWLAAQGKDWTVSLTGQLDYLWYEVSTNSVFSSMIASMNELPDTLEGAKKAARIWVRIYGLYMVDNEPDILFTNYYPGRDAAAEMYWNKLTHQTERL